MLRKFGPNQVVGLEEDAGFIGVITGPVCDGHNVFTGKWIVGVKEAGSSPYRGQALIEESKLVERSEPPAYVPPPRGVKKARTLAPGYAPAEPTH